jgi:hypothetical protein
MRLDRKGIPADVLKGRSRKYRSVHTIYKSVLIREVMVRINRAFWTKAKGGTDDLGNKWLPLSPATHAYKPLSPIEKNTYKIDDKLVRGLLTPEQNKIWQAIFSKTYSRLVKRGTSSNEAKKIAAKRAWAVIKAKGARTKIGLNRITDINVRYGRLVASTAPGKVTNNRYYPPKNQLVKFRPRGKTLIKLILPYADAVDAVRPIIPDDISLWIIEANEIAIREARVMYERIQAVTPDRKRRNSRRQTRGNKRGRDSNSSRR